MLRLGQRILKGFVRLCFRLFYELEVAGIENVPKTGRVIIAANHVNYFDAPMLLAFIPRPIHFVAASAGFRVPLWAFLMKLYGTIRIERGRPDAGAMRESIRVLENESALGIFPEGTFTEDGHLFEAKLGTAHIAIRTGAPIVPVTISGAFHSWPRLGPMKRRVPRPWRIRLTFHEPIRFAADETARRAPDKAVARELTTRIVDALNRTLEPAVRAEKKIDKLVAGRAPPIRLYELFPVFLAVALAFLFGRRTEWFSDPVRTTAGLKLLVGFLVLGIVYLLYLVVDLSLTRQTVLTRALRSYSPLIFLIVYYPLLVRAIPWVAEVERGVPASYPVWLSQIPGPWRRALTDGLAVTYLTFVVQLLLGLRYYHFNRYLLLQRYVRGLLLCVYGSLLAILFVPMVGHRFPLAVAPASVGVVAAALERGWPGRVLVLGFPTVPISLSMFALVFDFLHRRRLFYALLVPAASGMAAAVLLRGYPLGAVAANALFVMVVVLYMRVFPITAHDGRAV